MIIEASGIEAVKVVIEAANKDAFQNDHGKPMHNRPERSQIADTFGPRAALDKNAESRPAGLINTFVASVIEADAVGG